MVAAYVVLRGMSSIVVDLNINIFYSIGYVVVVVGSSCHLWCANVVDLKLDFLCSFSVVFFQSRYSSRPRTRIFEY